MRKFPPGGATISILRNAIDLPEKEILSAHARAKEALLAEVAARTGLVLNPKVLTLGFARRVATYKRATLLFTDPKRLVEIATAAGGLQIIYAGKAHPQDEPGKALIQQVVEDAARFSNDVLQHRLSGKLRMGLGRAAHRGRGCVGEHAASGPTRPPAPAA
jgi:glucan phosphorylase